MTAKKSIMLTLVFNDARLKAFLLFEKRLEVGIHQWLGCFVGQRLPAFNALRQVRLSDPMAKSRGF